jgi:hypothetical protein
MSDFPELNMSIGEYYKLLMEGKRPTRQRTVKEEIKKPEATITPSRSSVTQSRPLSVQRRDMTTPGRDDRAPG